MMSVAPTDILHSVYLFLGSNLGDSASMLYLAKKAICEQIGEIEKSSSLYRTAAWGKTDQPDFLNQLILVKTKYSPESILQLGLEIEKQLGRVRKEHWGQRSIDIDILYYDQVIIKTSTLTIPHSEIQNRKFELIPLVEISPSFVHPVLQKTQFELLKECTDQLAVKKL
ncbi:MAG: 2-amino-4-hydroxy-6-hydroxymethyldihydropteridine diphosphokinase [Cyclobacteriaceae bacterium]